MKQFIVILFLTLICAGGCIRHGRNGNQTMDESIKDEKRKIISILGEIGVKIWDY